LIVVGSQIGLFEELKLLASSKKDLPADGITPLPRPNNLRTLINVLDYNDVLSYRLAPIVSGVAEFSYVTAELFGAHGAYFSQPRLHERLRVRLQEARIGVA
jgi:hypothetical protein